MAKFVRIDNCAFNRVPSLLRTVRATADVENGTLVTVGGLVSGERELREYSVPATGDTMIGVVCTPEVEYDERGYHGLDTFVNKVDDDMRVGILTKGDIFSIGDDDTTNDVVAGELTAKYLATETSGRFKYKVLEVQ